MQRFTIGLLALISVSGCGSRSDVSKEDDAAVYDSLLLDDCCTDRAILQEVTDSAGLAPVHQSVIAADELRGFTGEIREAVADLYVRSRLVQRLPDSLSVASEERRAGADSVRALLHQVQQEHQRRLPNNTTVVLISAVGYSRDRQVAVVRIIKVCGVLCGGTTVRAIRRHPGGWVPAEAVWDVVF